MEINDVLIIASKYKDIDTVLESKMLEEFKASIDLCASRTVDDFQEEKIKLLIKKKEYDDKVLKENQKLLSIFSGSISLFMGGLSIVEVIKKKSYKYNSSISLFRSSIKITQEILCLALSGFADGVIVRWRSLFENFIILKYLLINDESISERFIKHNVIIRKKMSDQFNKSLGTNKHIEDENSIQGIMEKYGHEYENQYGWLSPDIPKKERNFIGICKIVGNIDQIALYKLSCEMIHSNAFSSVVSFSNYDDIISIGPSDRGLEKPVLLTLTTMCFIYLQMINFHYGESAIGKFLINYILKIQQNISAIFPQLSTLLFHDRASPSGRSARNSY